MLRANPRHERKHHRNALRAIVIREDDKIDEAAFKTLIRQATASNASRSGAKAVKTG